MFVAVALVSRSMWGVADSKRVLPEGILVSRATFWLSCSNIRSFFAAYITIRLLGPFHFLSSVSIRLAMRLIIGVYETEVYCHGLNVHAPPNPHFESPPRHVTVLGGRALGR